MFKKTVDNYEVEINVANNGSLKGMVAGFVFTWDHNKYDNVYLHEGYEEIRIKKGCSLQEAKTILSKREDQVTKCIKKALAKDGYKSINEFVENENPNCVTKYSVIIDGVVAKIFTSKTEATDFIIEKSSSGIYCLLKEVNPGENATSTSCSYTDNELIKRITNLEKELKDVKEFKEKVLSILNINEEVAADKKETISEETISEETIDNSSETQISIEEPKKRRRGSMMKFE
ncbi:MAG: hypothetical protein ACRDBY_08665 [Cetobacterium sp.]